MYVHCVCMGAMKCMARCSNMITLMCCTRVSSTVCTLHETATPFDCSFKQWYTSISYSRLMRVGSLGCLHVIQNMNFTQHVNGERTYYWNWMAGDTIGTLCVCPVLLMAMYTVGGVLFWDTRAKSSKQVTASIDHSLKRHNVTFPLIISLIYGSCSPDSCHSSLFSIIMSTVHILPAVTRALCI